MRRSVGVAYGFSVVVDGDVESDGSATQRIPEIGYVTGFVGVRVIHRPLSQRHSMASAPSRAAGRWPRSGLL